MNEINLEEAKERDYWLERERDYWLEREREFMRDTYCGQCGEQGKITPVVQELSKN